MHRCRLSGRNEMIIALHIQINRVNSLRNALSESDYCPVGCCSRALVLQKQACVCERFIFVWFLLNS